jgi:hypothetical protein
MFIVQRAESVPCEGAKAVDPMDVPPMKPAYLPRPYGWEVFHRRSDPNNPYNLIQEIAPLTVESAQPQSGNPALAREGVSSEVRTPEASAPRSELAPPSASASVPTESPLALADSELDDLALIVELSQHKSPAAFDDVPGGRVQLARSLAFEARMRDHLADRGQPAAGPVVLFVADVASEAAFYGNFTFVQHGLAYHPSGDNPLELGVLRGQLGPAREGARVLGYVVLPERLDPTRPIDIYLDDRLLTASFVN